MNRQLRALNRFGLGARVGERGRIADPRRWLRDQLKGGAPLMASPPGCSGDEIADALRGFRMAQQSQRDSDRQEARRRVATIASAEARAAFGNRVTTQRPF